MKVTVLINPRSGKKRAPALKSLVDALGKEYGAEVTFRTIERAGEGTTFAKEAVANGADRIISIGGDGTLNAIAAGLLGSTVPLGIVAMGSGNGYARSLKLPLDPEKALRKAFTGSAQPMDVCFLNDHPFLGTAGIGFDAQVAHEFDKSRGRGMWNYMRIIVQQIFGAKAMRVVVKANNTTEEHQVLMLVFCNTREFGNGAVISPGSLPDDGSAELQAVAKPSLVALIHAFYLVYTNRANRSKHIRTLEVSEAVVHQEGTLAHLDGEPLVVGHDVRFRLEPKRLLVVR